jgi:hypothetical protein
MVSMILLEVIKGILFLILISFLVCLLFGLIRGFLEVWDDW